jgi:hypothetical protein
MSITCFSIEVDNKVQLCQYQAVSSGLAWCSIWSRLSLLDFLNYQSIISVVYHDYPTRLETHDKFLHQIMDQSVTAEEIFSLYQTYDILTESDLETLLGSARKN